MPIKLIEPSIEIISAPKREEVYRILAIAASNCYRSNPKDKELLIKKIVKAGHHSVLEHVQVTFKLTCDRAVSHELVRHRIGVAYSQESQRYVNYKDELEVIRPLWYNTGDNVDKEEFCLTCITSHDTYKRLLLFGLKPEQARGVLPNATATRIVVSMNLRALLHFIKLRGSQRAHPDIRFFAKELEKFFSSKYPAVFCKGE